MNIRIPIVVAIAAFGLGNLVAQNSCGTDHYHEILKKSDPGIEFRESAFNEAAKNYVPLSRRTKYIIPVVFHVIHLNGEGNISREQILDQIDVLNEDFSNLNANKSAIRAPFLKDTTNIDIEFRLANMDPQGNCTDGINRVYSPYSNNSSQTTEEIKSLPGLQWDYRKYLNIYVVNSIDNSGGTGIILGYAVFPFSTSAARDGIVLRHDRVGRIGTAATTNDGGRTLTHEVGHWLGLFHTFQGGCSGFGDGCADTPPVNGTFVNANCPANGNSCSTDAPDRLDMWENYMDYSNGTCMAMFTKDQRTRAYSSLTQTPRNSLLTNANHIATGVVPSSSAPQAFFSSNYRVVCENKPVQFYDNSCKGQVDSRVWTFVGGSPSSSNAENPVITYPAAGEYEVKLTATNTLSSTTTNIIKYIKVLPAKGINPTYLEGFENTGSGNFDVEPLFNSGVQWTLNSTTGFNSSNCYQAKIDANTPVSSTFSIKLPPVNLSTLKGNGPKVTFYGAYAPNANASSSEILRVFVSTDCGQNYTQVLQRIGAGLFYSGAPSTSNFSPTSASQWRLFNVSLSAYDDQESVIVRLDVESNGGNSFFLDDINIGQFVSNIQDVANIGYKLFPNPATNQVTFELDKVREVNYITVNDLSGREVAKKVINKVGKIATFDNSKNLKGLFIITLHTQDGNSSSSIVFE